MENYDKTNDKMKINKNNFQSWAIEEQLFNFIRNILPDGSTILELGSGTGTIELCKFYTVYSIEHDKRWLGTAPDTNYIYAPIENNWYDRTVLETEIKSLNYDLVLVDGPPGSIGRGGILNNLDLFNTDVPFIFDDTNRKAEYELAFKFQNITKGSIKTFKGFEKEWIVIQ
jgi:hypothetical protein